MVAILPHLPPGHRLTPVDLLLLQGSKPQTHPALFRFSGCRAGAGCPVVARTQTGGRCTGQPDTGRFYSPAMPRRQASSSSDGPVGGQWGALRSISMIFKGRPFTSSRRWSTFSLRTLLSARCSARNSFTSSRRWSIRLFCWFHRKTRTVTPTPAQAARTPTTAATIISVWETAGIGRAGGREHPTNGNNGHRSPSRACFQACPGSQGSTTPWDSPANHAPQRPGRS